MLTCACGCGLRIRARRHPYRSGHRPSQPKRATRERFEEKIRRGGSGCHEFTGEKNHFGYGAFYVHSAGRSVLAHRVAWELYRGPIPAGLHVLHRCDNPPCCNPDHLFLGTHDDNMADMANKGRAGGNGWELHSHCKHGHEFTPENTLYNYGSGGRACRECGRSRAREYQRRRRRYHTAGEP